MKSFLVIALLAVALADNWALIVGGADGRGNYSIQSNPCRQYEDLIRAGFPPERIIVQIYTSVKTATWNPWPGKIFTMPAEDMGRDHAEYGCFDKVDYTKDDINREVFFGIITGDVERVKKATGKENPRVIKGSTSTNVFIYFIDHGSEGLIVVGKDRVKEKEFVEMLVEAHTKKNFGKMVFYMEACHSGSMFRTMPTDINILAMSSSDAKHNAYMSNCPPNDKINGKAMGACISGLWDNFYMEDIEINPQTTIGANIDRVTEAVKKINDQTVCHWGDMKMRDLFIKDFVMTFPKSRGPAASPKSVVALPDVPRHLAKWAAIRSENSNEALNEYIRIAMEDAKQEVEAMRLAVSILGEEAADLAVRFGNDHYESECVTDLVIGLAENCGHSIPIPDTTRDILHNICLPGFRAPEVDWKNICM